MPEYLLLSGETITYPDPSPTVAAFLDRLRAATTDPAVTIHHFLALVYGEDNPILDRNFLPGRGMVTRAVFDNPVWWVMSDLIGVKRAHLGLLDMDKVEKAYTVSVPEAATQLGITQSSVRAAITARKLAAHMRNGQWYTRPESIASYKVSNRGRKKAVAAKAPAPIRARAGGGIGVSLSVVVQGGELIKEGKELVFPAGWQRATVRTTGATSKGKSVRVFEIVPGEAEEEIRVGELYVRGPFAIARKINNAKEANDTWKAARVK